MVTPVTLTVAASVDVNPDSRNRASPILVRVYALKSTGPFDNADFFSLFEKDQATLGAELVQREELLLKPGDSRLLKMTLAADVKAIAVMGAYRDLERARWRAGISPPCSLRHAAVAVAAIISSVDQSKISALNLSRLSRMATSMFSCRPHSAKELPCRI